MFCINRLFLKVGELDEMIPEILKYSVIITWSVVFWYKDLIMDILVALDVSFLYTTFWDFKSIMVLVLWVTIFLSPTIMGLRVILYNPDKFLGFESVKLSSFRRALIRFVFVLFCPFSPAILLYLSTRVSRKIRIQEKTILALFK